MQSAKQRPGYSSLCQDWEIDAIVHAGVEQIHVKL